MDKQLFKDRILETENLTDELEDADADWLINWAINQLDQVLFDTKDEESAGENVNALMAVIRRLNRICGWRQSKSVEELAVDLENLSSLFVTAFRDSQLPDPNEYAAAAVHLASIETNTQALEFLTHWGHKRTSSLVS